MSIHISKFIRSTVALCVPIAQRRSYKRCSENKQHINVRIPMQKCGFNKVAKHVSRTSSCKKVFEGLSLESVQIE